VEFSVSRFSIPSIGSATEATAYELDLQMDKGLATCAALPKTKSLALHVAQFQVRNAVNDSPHVFSNNCRE